MSKSKKKGKKFKPVSDSKLMKEVMAQTTELLETYSPFAAKIEDWTSGGLYDKEYSEIPNKEAERIRNAVKRYVEILIALSELMKERLDG